MKSKHIYTYCIYAAFFVVALISATQGAMLTSIIEEYTLRSYSQGATSSAQYLGQAIALFFLFIQAGRVSKPTLVTIALIGAVAVLFVISQTPPFPALMLTYCIFGVAYGTVSSTTSALVADMYVGDNTPKYMSRLHGALGLGWLSAPLLFAALHEIGLRWNETIRITMLIIIAILIPYFILTKLNLKKVTLPKSSTQKITITNVKQFFKENSGLLLILSSFFYASHQAILIVWIHRFVSVFLETPSLGPISLSLLWAGITTSRLFAHKIPGHPAKKVFLGNIAAAIGICIGLLSNKAEIMTVSVLIAGLLNGFTIPVLLATGCEGKSSNTYLPTNMIMLAVCLAYMISLPIVGYMVSLQPMSSGIYLSAACALICGILTKLILRQVIVASKV